MGNLVCFFFLLHKLDYILSIAQLFKHTGIANIFRVSVRRSISFFSAAAECSTYLNNPLITGHQQ